MPFLGYNVLFHLFFFWNVTTTHWHNAGLFCGVCGLLLGMHCPECPAMDGWMAELDLESCLNDVCQYTAVVSACVHNGDLDLAPAGQIDSRLNASCLWRFASRSPGSHSAFLQQLMSNDVFSLLRDVASRITSILTERMTSWRQRAATSGHRPDFVVDSRGSNRPLRMMLKRNVCLFLHRKCRTSWLYHQNK